MAHEQVLAETDFFANAPADVLSAISAAASTRTLVRGDVLFEADDDPESLFVVLSGRIAIAIDRPFDHRESVLALMEDGDLFGEFGLLDEGKRSAGARAIEPSVVLEVSYDIVRNMLSSHPQMMWNVVRVLVQRIRKMDMALADSVFLDVTGRTAKRLLELSGGNDTFTLPITQEELAGMVGASRERVNKAIASFIKLGWLDQQDRHYVIKNRAELDKRAK